jgi:hypothetical protein
VRYERSLCELSRVGTPARRAEFPPRVSIRECCVEVEEAPESVLIRYELSRGRTEVAEPFVYTEERGRFGFGGVECGCVE